MNQPANKPSSPMQQPATWDAVAGGYAELMGRHIGYAQEALRVAAPRSSAHVLDVATGSGVLAFLAAPRVAHVDAVDFSPGMIEQVRQRCRRDGVRNIDASVMDAQTLTFPDASFDSVFCLFGFMFFPDRARAFRELLRVLRPSGRAVITTWAPLDRRPMMKIGFDALAEAVPDLPPMQKGDLQHPDDCLRELREAGFREPHVHSFSSSFHVDSPEHYLDTMERTGAPFASLKARMGEAAWTSAFERMLAAVRRHVPATGTDLAAEAMILSGTR